MQRGLEKVNSIGLTVIPLRAIGLQMLDMAKVRRRETDFFESNFSFPFFLFVKASSHGQMEIIMKVLGFPTREKVKENSSGKKVMFMKEIGNPAQEQDKAPFDGAMV